jgi:hypothetical protein
MMQMMSFYTKYISCNSKCIDRVVEALSYLHNCIIFHHIILWNPYKNVRGFP